MATSVGEIGLDLVVNQKKFQKQMSGVTGLAKKAGAALAAAFATKKIVDFGKQCLQLGSDLSEVQNVVDVTFPGMSAQVDKFAKSAAQSFGLSETMAKRYTGTFGSMAKAFGFTEKQAFDMGTTLTGLAGDVASFYNLSQDEAYTKLKSVFTGETESLKDLGVVMTQSALDSYAMANGFGKTTQAMSEAEKVALRYAFVQNQLSAASGDFARTSGSWANQVRILKLQFDSLKATIGQGLINVFTPVIKVINTLMGKLVTLANHFKAFTELITGKKSSGSSSGGGTLSDVSVPDLADQYDNTTASANDTAKANDKVAKSMKKAQKAAEGYLSPLDTIHKISSPDDTAGEDDAASPGSTGSGTPANLGGGQGAAVDYGSMAKGETVLDKLDSKFVKLFKSIKKGVQPTLDSLKRLWNEGLSKLGTFTWTALKDFYEHFLVPIGQWVFGEGLPRFIDALNDGLMAVDWDKINDSLAKLWDALAPFAINVGEGLLWLWENVLVPLGTWTLNEVVPRFLTTLSTAITILNDVIEELKPLFEWFWENVLLPIAQWTGGAFLTIWDGILSAVQKARDVFNEIYDNHLKPLFDSIASGLSEIFGKLLDGYNTYVAPVLQYLSEKFQELMEGPFGIMINKIVEVLGKIIDIVRLLWETILVPLFSWIAEMAMPVLAALVAVFGSGLLGAIELVIGVISGFMSVLSGILDFVIGIFSTDWSKAWEDVKNTAKEKWDGIRNSISEIWNNIKNTIIGKLNEVKGNIKNAWSSVKSNTGAVWNGIKTSLTATISAIKHKVSAVFGNIKNTISNVWNSIKSTTSNVWSSIADAVKSPINAIIGFINSMVSGMASGVNTIASMLNNLRVDIPDWVPGFGGRSLGFNLPTWDPPQIPYLASGAVIPPNAPFMAMLGDQKNGNNIEAPESLLRKVVREESKGSNSGGNSTYVIPIYVSGRKLLEIIIEEAELKQARSGKNIFKLSTT